MAKSDVNFVHSLHAQANATVNKKVNTLFILIALFFIGVIVWAAFSDIDELARGEGKIIPSEKIQTVQNLDGGVISEILIKEGERVKKGESLMKIDTTRYQASLEENKQQYLALLATKARLQAQYKQNPKKELVEIKFPQKVFDDATADVIYTENQLFRNTIDELKSSLEVLESQFKQKYQELTELKSKRDRLEKTLALTKEELETTKRLVKSGAKSKMDLIAIEKEYNSIEGDLEATKLSIPRIEFSIQEAKDTILEKIRNYRVGISEELQETETEIKKFESILISEKDKLAKTVVSSPVNGTVKEIKINTIGGVVKSGMDLIDIIPDSDILLVEAKIDPKDIAFINPSQKAVIKITAYDFSIYGGLDGKIVEISQDSFKDEDSKEGKTYYKILIQTDKNYLEKDGKRFYMIPGMIASVDIVTGKKTILDFILKPILKTKQSALHER